MTHFHYSCPYKKPSQRKDLCDCKNGYIERTKKVSADNLEEEERELMVRLSKKSVLCGTVSRPINVFLDVCIICFVAWTKVYRSKGHMNKFNEILGNLFGY